MNIEEFISFTAQDILDLRNTGRYSIQEARRALMKRDLRHAISTATHCSSMGPEERIELLGSALEKLLLEVL